MQARIVVLNAPRNPGAVLPAMTPTAQAASNGVCRVTGAPGTLPVRAPKPAALAPYGPTRKTQGSYNAPTYIRPSLYIATPQCGRPPARILADTITPVPAVKPVLVASNRMAQPRRIGGRTVTRAGRPLVRWPVYGGGYA